MAAADPDVAALQQQVENMKAKQKELEKTIEEMTEENKIKVALQVKQIDERNKLEKRISELQGILKETSDGAQKKVEKLKREHSLEMEDLKSLLYSNPVASTESEEIRSKRSSVYLQIAPPDDSAERVRVTSSNKDLQNKISQLERERAEICTEFQQIETGLKSQLATVKGENKRIASELEAKSSEFERMAAQYADKFRQEHDSYIDELKKRTLSKPVEEPDTSQTDEIHATLNSQLTAAHEKITSLELEMEQMKLAETDLRSDLENSKLAHEARVTTSDEEAKRLQKRVDELAKSEGLLREECERLKNDYDLRVNTQNTSMTDMKTVVDSMKNQEEQLRKQMEETQKDYECKLERTTSDYNIDMSRLAESIQMHQTELTNVVMELEAARKESIEITNRFSAQLDQKHADLDAMYDRCQQLEITSEQTAKEQDEKIDGLRKDVQNKSAEMKKLKVELQEKTSALETAEQRLTEAEQNLSVWKSAASEKEWSESELMRRLAEIEAQAKLQREALQDKVTFLSKQVTEKDSSDVYERMTILEQSLAEKEKANLKYETRVAELTDALDKQRAQYEATFADMDEVLERQMNKTRELEQALRDSREQAETDKQAAVKEVEEELEKKRTQADEASSKVGDVRAESDDRAKDLKTRIEELNKRLEDKDKQLMEKDREMQERLHAMMDEFEGERQMLILDAQATAKVLNERLDKEREAMTGFKEHVKKQFDERQDQVKEMMNAMKARFAETIKDKEEVFNRRVQKAEKAKEREKLQALTEREDKFQQQFKDYKERQEANFRAAVEELKRRYDNGESVKDAEQIINAISAPAPEKVET